jgi:hypothetical protein
MRHHIVAFLFLDGRRRTGDITRIGKNIMCRVSPGVGLGNHIPGQFGKIKVDLGRKMARSFATDGGIGVGEGR